MGYYTKFEMDFTGSATEADIIAALKEINPNYFDYDVDHLDTLFEEEMKWYDATSDMIKLSERFPQMFYLNLLEKVKNMMISGESIIIMVLANIVKVELSLMKWILLYWVCCKE